MPCASAILRSEPCILEDAAEYIRSPANPLVGGDFGLCFHAGVPFRTRRKHRANPCPRHPYCSLAFSEVKVEPSHATSIDSTNTNQRSLASSVRARTKVFRLSRHQASQHG
jgi:hypothetical protein